MLDLIYQIRLPIVIGELEWCLMGQASLISLATIILVILFPLVLLATIEMPYNSPPKFSITPGEWATAKRTPCIVCPILNSMIHYSVCNDKDKYCTILWTGGTYCGQLDLVIPPGYWL